MLQNTPAGNHSSLDGLLLSQLPNWEKQGSMETSYPPMTSERYIVQEGDTFESISQQFYSNKNYSTDVAMNNGFMSNQTQGQLIAGQVIRLPQYTPLSNNVKNSLPYQKFMAIMEGNLSPYMVIEQEQSFLAVILEIVAVVVAIAAAPHLAPEIFATVTALTLSVVAAGVAALTEFFGQEFLVQLGVEKNISWSDIESAALSAAAGVKGGLMSSVNIGSNVVIQAAMRAGIVNVVSQFAEFAAGDIKALDLKQILASMVGAGLGQKVLPQLDNEFQWGQTGDDAASAVMDGFIDSAIEQRGLNVENMAMQFAQSAAEDWLSTGRGAISQAAARDSETKPATGKIPAPADTGNAWKTSGREAEKQAAANDDRWKKVGAAATHQSTAAQNYMLNQMQQAIAKSTEINLDPDKIFNAYAAHVGQYNNLNAAAEATNSSGNSNNSAVNTHTAAPSTLHSIFSGVGDEFSKIGSSIYSSARHVAYDIAHPSAAIPDLINLNLNIASDIDSVSQQIARGIMHPEQQFLYGAAQSAMSVQNFADASVEQRSAMVTGGVLSAGAMFLGPEAVGFVGDSIGVGRAFSFFGDTINSTGGKIANKISLVGAKEELDPYIAQNFSSYITENPVSARTYSQVQAHGTNISLDFSNDIEPGLYGAALKNNNLIEIYMQNNRNVKEAVSTFVHEGAHMSRYFRGFKLSTQYEEYFAMRREFLFNTGSRPTLAQRQEIWNQVLYHYGDLPVGQVPVSDW